MDTSVFKTIHTLLDPISKNANTSQQGVYFVDADNYPVSMDGCCCDKDECVKKTKKSTLVNIGRRRITPVYYNAVNADHDTFDFCAHCGAILNEFISYVEREIEHYETIDSFPTADEAYELAGIFESMRWYCDYRGEKDWQIKKRAEIEQRAIELAEKFAKIIQHHV